MNFSDPLGLLSNCKICEWFKSLFTHRSGSSWDPSKPLPDNPSGLGPDWKRNPAHKAPHDEQYVNGKGDKVDWHKGRPGEKGYQGKDHWHWIPAGGEKQDHVRPGQTVAEFGLAGATGALIGIIVETAPEWAPALAVF